MEILLADGQTFWVSFPVFVPMVPAQGGFAPEPVAIVLARCVPVYTDEDLARRGMEAQGDTDMVPVPVADETRLRFLVGEFQKRGATHLAIDICTAGERPGGFVVPISTALG